jgi:hypothetical protein
LTLPKNGTYDIQPKGILNLHGINQPRDLKGKLTVENQKINLVLYLDVKIIDHKIDVPKLSRKIAEVISIKSKYTFTLHKKSKNNPT